MRASFWPVCIVLLGLSGCGSAKPPPPFQLSMDMKQLMDRILDPNADVVWAAVGTIVTAEGEQKIVPQTDEQWTAVRNAAATVLESGNLLMMDGRARNTDDWMQKVQELMRRANEALQAIEAKDADALFTAGSDLYLACAACHAEYIFNENGEAADASN